MATTMDAPEIVSPAEWQAAREEMLAKEKAHTRAGEELSSQRRAMPRMRIEKDYVFEGSDGELSLPDLFEGRSQLIVYHFMWQGPHDPGKRCLGCSLTIDSMTHPAHLNARDITFALVSRDAPVDEFGPFKEHMGWYPEIPWYSTSPEFPRDLGVPDGRFGLNVFLRDGDDILRTYFTGSRGTEHLGTAFGYMDLSPFGRQEKWEASPEGTPQQDTYSALELHDEYPHLAATH